MNKIYLVREYGGQWEDSWEQIVKAHKNKEDAEKFVKETQEERNRLISYQGLWEEIESKMDDSTPEDIWEDPNAETWDDDADLFIELLKEWHPEYLEIYSIDLLKEIYEFYNNYYPYYDESYFDIDEIELE